MASAPDATPFLSMMESEGLGSLARAGFARALATLASDDAVIGEDEIDPVTDLASADALAAADPGTVDDLLDRTVLVKLNGGLGTSMGLERAKSLLEVRSGRTFLDLIVAQVDHWAERRGHRPRLLFMNSFSTAADTRDYLAAHHPHLGDPAALDFVQNKVPKVDADTLTVPHWNGDDALRWCPPGHGDLYTALVESGTLARLRADGVRYAFVSNADNLGATLDVDILSWFAEAGVPLAMEVTRRTAADRKGGHLARRRSDGHLVLREAAQTARNDADAFGDIDRHRFFNTNNLWLDLDALAERIDGADGPAVLPLPVMHNRKSLDPRDPSSPAVVQLETAMGAAIECFDEATAIVVDRSRFAPVKTTDDLFALRSDAYETRDDGSVGLVAARGGVPPTVHLDATLYRLVDGMEALAPDGSPSLVHCDTLTVEGAWRLGPEVTLAGDVTLHAPSDAAPTPLAPGRYENTTVRAETANPPAMHQEVPGTS